MPIKVFKSEPGHTWEFSDDYKATWNPAGCDWKNQNLFIYGIRGVCNVVVGFFRGLSCVISLRGSEWLICHLKNPSSGTTQAKVQSIGEDKLDTNKQDPSLPFSNESYDLEVQSIGEDKLDTNKQNPLKMDPSLPNSNESDNFEEYTPFSNESDDLGEYIPLEKVGYLSQNQRKKISQIGIGGLIVIQGQEYKISKIKKYSKLTVQEDFSINNYFCNINRKNSTIGNLLFDSMTMLDGTEKYIFSIKKV